MSLWNSVTGLFTPASKSMLGIDIGSSSIKVVQVRNVNGVMTLHTYGELALGPVADKPVGSTTSLSESEIAQAVRDIVSKSKCTTTQAVVAIPASASLMFMIELPRGSESSLSEIVPNEARKYIPVPLTEVSLDWMVVPDMFVSEGESQTPNESPIHVLVAATRNESITLYSQAMASAGIAVQSFELEVFSLIRSCIRRELSPIALVDFGASKTKVSIIHHGAVFSTQMISRGSYALSQALERGLQISFDKAEEIKRSGGLESVIPSAPQIITPFVDQLFVEVAGIITRYEKEYHHAVEKMILVGGGSQLIGLPAHVQKTATMQVIGSNAFETLERPELLHEVLTHIDPSFAVSVGLAIKPFTQ
jgi:type IV pilus assembly protein PilM